MKIVDFNHLTIVDESYWQHLKWCLYSTYVFFIMIFLALIHGFFPFLLSNVPDRVMITYLRKFKERRVDTGQEERLPE
jgi:hypothetical protein